MATVFPAHLHHGWIGKISSYVAGHRAQTLLVIIASLSLGGSFGFLMFSTMFATGDWRAVVMLLPHAVATTVFATCWLATIFSVGHYDP